ncbi:hypothetical protein KFE25_007714 [Diacronema lutheri]|uniref:Uncharacterized protein n=2 Tax=Diacronema lutheri TaxID=2081491 RepID=A0A8J5XHT4_DIALT|nr:hypothetical protein KFE25_007714 [Diacronema lutheri]
MAGEEGQRERDRPEGDAELSERSRERERAELRAHLSDVTSGMASQLGEIAAEMSRLKAEIYGDEGLGRIQQELASIKSDLSAPVARDAGASAGRAGRASLHISHRARIGGVRRHEGEDEQLHAELAALEEASGRLGRGIGLAVSVVVVVFVLCGPLWPLTASALDGLLGSREVPWFEREL